MRGDVEENSLQAADDAIMHSDSPEHEYTGKVFGAGYYGGYPVEVKDSNLSKEDCCCSQEKDCSCGCGGSGCCHK